MGNERFEYRTTKSGVVRVFWEGRAVSEIGGARGQRLAAALAEGDPDEIQGLLARATGNFKRGNERSGRRR